MIRKIWAMLFIGVLSILNIHGQTIYRVPSEYPTIQDAVDRVLNYQDIILIEPGTYTGEGNRDIVIDGEDVTIVGDGSAQEVVIDAGGVDGEVHNIFNIMGYSNFSVCLRNLTLQGSWGKSCVYVNDASLTLHNCVIRNNSNSQYGSAISMFGGQLFGNQSVFNNNDSLSFGGAIYSSGCLDFTLCTFSNNQSGVSGGAIRSFCVLHLDRCVFCDNEAEWNGGAIKCSEEGYISNSLFVNNCSHLYGGALECYHGRYLEMHNCQFRKNKSVVGGGFELYHWVEAKIANCEFVNNTAEYSGGGVYIGGIDWTEFTNNTISDNRSEVEGGGLCLETTYEINVSNSIICNNDAPAVPDLLMKDYEETEFEADAYISYSVVDPLKTRVEGKNHRLHLNEGIISVSPAFEDSNNGNYQLSRQSPCIDNGMSENVSDYDCIGQPRQVGEGVDIGAYEYQFPMQYGVNLFMDNTHLTASDYFNLESVSVTGTWNDPVELAVMLDINGNYYFFPDWKEPFTSVPLILEYGRIWQPILEFEWPDGIGSGSGLAFWSVLLNQDDQSVIGEPDVIHWSYY